MSNHEFDLDDTNALDVPWCYGCDDYATCGEYEPDGAPSEQWEVTTPAEVYANDDYYDFDPVSQGFYDDDPSPYDGTYSEM